MSVIPRISGHRVLTGCMGRGKAYKLQNLGRLGQFYFLSGVGAAIDIVLRKVYNFFLHQALEWGRNALFFFNKFFEVDGLIAKLPEMMFGVVLIAIGKKLL